MRHGTLTKIHSANRIEALTNMAYAKTMNEILLHLVGLEEDHFLEGFHQQVQKEREKAWHGRQIKNKIFKVGDLVLLYDSKFVKLPGKFCMHWLGPYQVKHVTSGWESIMILPRGVMVG